MSCWGLELCQLPSQLEISSYSGLHNQLHGAGRHAMALPLKEFTDIYGIRWVFTAVPRTVSWHSDTASSSTSYLLKIYFFMRIRKPAGCRFIRFVRPPVPTPTTPYPLVPVRTKLLETCREIFRNCTNSCVHNQIIVQFGRVTDNSHENLHESLRVSGT